MRSIGMSISDVLMKSTKVQNPQRELCAGALDVRSMHCFKLIGQPARKGWLCGSERASSVSHRL